MFLDGRNLPNGTILETDIAVIGAGAAGITIARELASSGRQIALIESGGLEPDEDSQALYEGESRGVDYPLAESRLRYFGGTTNHWGGWCRPLASIDFEARPWLPNSGWPISRAELDPFYLRAQRICQLGSADFDDPEPWRRKTQLRPLDLPGDDIVTRFFIYSPPTRFGEVYRADIEAAPQITTYLHSNVVELVPNAEANRVETLRLATLAGTTFSIRPRLCILAAGGIENARLLLASQGAQSAGLGNGRDLVGRYFMEHVTVPGDVASIAVADSGRIPSYYSHTTSVGDVSMRAIFMPSDDYLRREQCLGSSLSIYEAHPPAGGGMEPAVVELLRMRQPGGDASRDPKAGMIYGVACATEPLPSPDNRVSLSRNRDALGVPQARLTWRPAPVERSDLVRNIETLARTIGAWGGGTARLLLAQRADWDQPEIGWGNHHMGTTRMSSNPTRGVVDGNCRMHGIGNLYVAGSSVFPTASPINPTLTIVALALRLSDHIKAEGSSG